MTRASAALPRLTGPWLGLYRALFVGVFGLALFSAAAATWHDARSNNDATRWVWSSEILGLGVRIFPPTTSVGWRIVRPFSTEALGQGIRPGDEIVSVNGHAVAHQLASFEFPSLFTGHEGARTSFVLRGKDGAVRTAALTWRAANVTAWYRGSGLDPWRQSMARRLAYDLMTVLLLIPALILFLRRPRDMVAGAFALALCLISVGPTVEYWSDVGLLRVHAVIANSAFIIVLMFGCAFPNGVFWPSWTRFSPLVMPLVYAPLVLVYGDFSNFLVFTIPAFLALVAILILRYRRLPEGAERQQFRWVAFGLAVGVSMLILRLPLVFIQGNAPAAPISPWIDASASLDHAMGFAVIGAGFAVALLKFRLYDAEALISRSATLAATTLLLAGVFGASEKAIEVFMTGLLGLGEESAAPVIGAGLAVILMTPLHGRVHRWIEKRFASDVWRLRERLPGFAATLAQRAALRGLCEELLVEIAGALRVTRGAIVVERGGRLRVAGRLEISARDVTAGLSHETLPRDDALIEDDAALPFRLALGEGAQAWLLLGPRPDGTAPNRDERQALADLAAPLGRALATAEALELRDSRIAALIGRLDARLAAVEGGARPIRA